MPIVAIIPGGLSGVMVALRDQGKMHVGSKLKAPVTMVGYLGQMGAKGSSGQGRLSLRAGLVCRGSKSRYVVEVDGGLRGVLFEAHDGRADFTGNLDAGDGSEYGFYARRQRSANGDTLLLTTTRKPHARKPRSR